MSTPEHPLKLRALVVDDSRIMRSIVMNTLRRTNIAEFEFSEAGDGVEALAKFHPAETDIIFADWNMPNMNGIELARTVRSTPSAAHVPIVMVSSERTPDKMREALQSAGVDAYICKPFTVEEVTQELTAVLATRSARSAAHAAPPAVAPSAPPPAPALGAGFFTRLLNNQG
jgi:two-component system chemotaxis response regulator CheY